MPIREYFACAFIINAVSLAFVFPNRIERFKTTYYTTIFHHPKGFYPFENNYDTKKLHKKIVQQSAIVGGAIALSSPVLADIPGFNDLFDPSKFQPVCPASDTIYQGLKGTAGLMIGNENAAEYGPLIASLLLRIRLEICVLESFLYEAVIPFIQQRGLSWVLPLHETLETFLGEINKFLFDTYCLNLLHCNL